MGFLTCCVSGGGEPSKLHELVRPVPESVKKLFAGYAGEAGVLDEAALAKFMQDQQGLLTGAASTSQALLKRSMSMSGSTKKHHKKKGTAGLDLKDFFEFLMDPVLNAAQVPSKVTHDMKCPLSHYFIYTSHNTYLTGNQLTSDSSVKPIVEALLQGCRGIELDLWEKNGLPVVYHGGTLTKAVPFEECIQAIKVNAFVASEYPVILTLENHLPLDTQTVAAEILHCVLGSLLYVPEDGAPACYESPHNLRGKVLIADKPVKEPEGTTRGGPERGSLPPEGEPLLATPEGATPEGVLPEGTPTKGVARELDLDSNGLSVQTSTPRRPATPKQAGSTPRHMRATSGAKAPDVTLSMSPGHDPATSPDRVFTTFADLIKSYTPGATPAGSPRQRRLGRATSATTDDLKFNTPTKEGARKGSKEMPRKQDSATAGLLDQANAKLAAAVIAQEVLEAPTVPLAADLGKLIYMPCLKPTEVSKEHAAKCYMANMSEPQFQTLTQKDAASIVWFTRSNLMRVYPYGLRFDSSNFNPTLAWAHGVQLAAMNMQGGGRNLWLQQGFFSSNGACGYVRKPNFLLPEGEGETATGRIFDPSVKRPPIYTLKVRVLHGRDWLKAYDSFSPPDFFLKVGTSGVPADTKAYRSEVCWNKFHPSWEKEHFVLPITVPELALLTIEVREADQMQRDDFVAQFCIPLPELQIGYRTLLLSDLQGKAVPTGPKLLCHFEIEAAA